MSLIAQRNAHPMHMAAKSIAKNTGMSYMTHNKVTHTLFISPVDLGAASDLKGWSAAAAAAPVPLTSIMREQQDLQRKKDGERVQLRDSVWQQVRASGC